MTQSSGENVFSVGKVVIIIWRVTLVLELAHIVSTKGFAAFAIGASRCEVSTCLIELNIVWTEIAIPDSANLQRFYCGIYITGINFTRI
jgi:hypothetical protein